MLYWTYTCTRVLWRKILFGAGERGTLSLLPRRYLAQPLMMDWKTKKRSGAGPLPARRTVSEGWAVAAWTVVPLPTSAVVSAVPWCPVLALSAGRRHSHEYL